MMRTGLCTAIGILAMIPLWHRDCAASVGLSAEQRCGPIALAVHPSGKRAIVANHASGTVMLVDLIAGKVIDEKRCGAKPSAIACSRDGQRMAVSNLWEGTVALFEVLEKSLRFKCSVVVGNQPRGLAFASNGESFYVALAGDSEVVHVDWALERILAAWESPVDPRSLVLSPDGSSLVVGGGRSATLRCLETKAGKQLWEKQVHDAFNMHGLAWSPDGKELVASHIHDRHNPIAIHNIREGWALDNRLTRVLSVPDGRTEYWQIALDVHGKAVGDPTALAYSHDGVWLALAAAGTHEVLVFRNTQVPWCSGDPGDMLDASLDREDGRLRRIQVGGRPSALAFVPGTTHLVVANDFSECLQILDAASGELRKTITLSKPKESTPAQRGERIFHDAGRSIHQWFSCHSCHPDGHTAGRKFDTLNDESYGNPKNTPTLRGVGKTGPWTWHGWQDKLADAVEKSLTETLFGPKPSPEDVKAVVAYLETLEHPPLVQRLTAKPTLQAINRGRDLFLGKAHCQKCHQGSEFTSTKTFDVQLGEDGSPFDGWNPPTLRGLRDRGPFLHDGRAESLDELLRLHHGPQKLGGKPLSIEERGDLIAFLVTL